MDRTFCSSGADLLGYCGDGVDGYVAWGQVGPMQYIRSRGA